MNKPINIQSFVCEVSKCPDIQQLKAENEKLKEKIIKLTEENGNLLINRNTAENKLQDTESRLISIQKANTHNLVLLQRCNNALEEIRDIAKSCMNKDVCLECNYYDDCEIEDSEMPTHDICKLIINKINEVLK